MQGLFRHLWIVRRNLSDGCIMVVLRGYWPYASLDHCVGVVKMSDESWSEERPEIYDDIVLRQLRPHQSFVTADAKSS